MTMTDATAVLPDDDQADEEMDELTTVYVELFRLEDENRRLRMLLASVLDA